MRFLWLGFAFFFWAVVSFGSTQPRNPLIDPLCARALAAASEFEAPDFSLVRSHPIPILSIPWGRYWDVLFGETPALTVFDKSKQRTTFNGRALDFVLRNFAKELYPADPRAGQFLAHYRSAYQYLTAPNLTTVVTEDPEALLALAARVGIHPENIRALPVPMELAIATMIDTPGFIAEIPGQAHPVVVNDFIELLNTADRELEALVSVLLTSMTMIEYSHFGESPEHLFEMLETAEGLSDKTREKLTETFRDLESEHFGHSATLETLGRFLRVVESAAVQSEERKRQGLPHRKPSLLPFPWTPGQIRRYQIYSTPAFQSLLLTRGEGVRLVEIIYSRDESIAED